MLEPAVAHEPVRYRDLIGETSTRRGTDSIGGRQQADRRLIESAGIADRWGVGS